MGARSITLASHPAERLRGLRRGGRWLAFWRNAMVVLGALALLHLAGGAPQPGIAAWLLVLFIFCLVAWVRFRAYTAGDRDERAALAAGVDGERAVARCLSKRLPRGYVVLNGLGLPGAGDLDHVVVGPTGLFVLETKNLAGAIGRTAHGWQRVKAGRRGGAYAAWIGDPDAQLERAIRALRRHLELTVPELYRGLRLRIEGMIVFPNRGACLAVGPGAFPAVRPDEAADLIARHQPECPLARWDVEQLVTALTAEPARRPTLFDGRERGQALVEVALVIPVLLLLAFGVVGIGRVLEAQMGVAGVAREAARAAALADTAAEATARGMARGQEVAAGYRLGNGTFQLAVDPGSFERGGQVRAAVRYEVALGDLPLLGWARVPLASTHAERIERFRSRWSGEGQP